MTEIKDYEKEIARLHRQLEKAIQMNTSLLRDFTDAVFKFNKLKFATMEIINLVVDDSLIEISYKEADGLDIIDEMKKIMRLETYCTLEKAVEEWKRNEYSVFVSKRVYRGLLKTAIDKIMKDY